MLCPLQRVLEKRERNGGKAISGNHEAIWNRNLIQVQMSKFKCQIDVKAQILKSLGFWHLALRRKILDYPPLPWWERAGVRGIIRDENNSKNTHFTHRSYG
jgi:hypothetical protein